MIKNFIFLGSPGVGKGTMAKLLATRKNLKHISTGDIFRSHIKNKTVLGKKVEAILESGKYVPDELTNAIVKDALEQARNENIGFILDGYPRTQNQADFLKDNHFQIDAVALLKAPSTLIEKRLQKRAVAEKRTDDTPEVIARRIAVYHAETAPLIKYYKQLKLIKEVDASGDIDQNYQALEKELY